MSTAVANRVDVLRLQVDDDGMVWYGDDSQCAVNSYAGVGEFFGQLPMGYDLPTARSIRLLGTASNAPLVVFLQTLRTANPAAFKRQRIWLCSPALVPTAGLRADSAAVLQHLWQPSRTSVFPGMWHEMNQLDYSTYAMIQELSKVHTEAPVPEVVRRIAAYHPAWPALSYIPFLDHDLACRMLCEIVDPRWFQHPHRPHRSNRLLAYLGITPTNAKAILGDCFPERYFNRARIVINAWYNRKFTKGDRLGKGKFLWAAFTKGGDKAAGLLRGTRRFVSFVVEFWLNAVRHAHPEAGFHPFHFFKDTDEAAGFLQHMTDWKPV